MLDAGGEGSTDLRPYVPRVAVEWLQREPGRRHRETDGTLVFVDISGFTAMSERLARLGRVGAEEVTDLLNHTFSRLLSVAYEDDGSLLKFGGDALLLLFDGPDHCARGTHAAWAMREKLRELQPLSSSAGDVRLRMSAGVHTGSIGMFLVGDGSHRELMVAGPAATEVVRMESAAGAGQIVVSRRVVRSLGGRIAVTPMGPGARLRSPPPPSRVAPAPDPRGPGASDLAGVLLSPTVRERLESGVPNSEHRPAAVGFIKCTGIDDLVAASGMDGAAEALERLVLTVAAAAEPDGVCMLATDVDAAGVKLILTAGVPSSHEWDGERLLRTMRRVLDADTGLALKMGAHFGPVFAGVVGPWFRLTYTVIGDIVNVAARVMGHAQPGELLATPEVLNRSQTLFQVSELPPFPVKGKRHPMTARRVGPIAASRARRPRARFRLAGRDNQLGALLDELDAAVVGEGRTAHLVGPAGIGKSRLVDELQERRPEVRAAFTACSRYESATPYHSVAALLRSLLTHGGPLEAEDLRAAVRQHAPHLEPMLPLLGDVVGLDLPDTPATASLAPAYRAERAAAAVCSLLEATLDGPTLVVVEDVHWADPESWNVIRTLARGVLRSNPWLLVVTARHQMLLAAEEDRELVVELRPLNHEAAREIVYAAVEEGAVSLERGLVALERADGNPFFLEELLSHGGQDELPDSVEALVQMQLDQLDPVQRETLGVAAVLGADVDVDLLARTTGVPAPRHHAGLSSLAGFLDPAGPGKFRFRHALVHDAAYARLPFRRRRELHRAAAAALEGGADPQSSVDLLAVHTHYARDWAKAREYSLAAAGRAAARFANLTAAEHYRRAIESSRHLRDLGAGELAGTWESLGDSLMLAGAYEEAVTAYRQARRLSDEARDAHLCGQIGQLRERQGRYGDALRWFGRAIRIERDAPAGERGRMLVESAIVRLRQGRPHDALELARQAEALAPDLQTAARVAYVRAWAAMLMGQDAPVDRALTLRLFTKAQDLIGQGLAYNIISMAAYYRGDWHEAADAYERAASLRKQVGDEVAAAAAIGNLGELLSDQGHFERARGLLEECRTVCAAAGFQSSRYFATMTLGRLEARLGNYDRAGTLLAEALAGLRGLGMAGLVFDAERCVGELAVFRADWAGALAQSEVLDRSAQLGGTAARLAGRRLRVCALLGAGDLASARREAVALLEALDPDGRDYDTALALVAAAAVLRRAGDAAAEEIHHRAADILEALGVVVPGELLAFGPTWAQPGVVGAGVPAR